LTKYQGTLLLNWELQPCDHIQCWVGLKPLATILPQCKSKQCCTK
jgi:hypothetical protein